MKKDPKNAEFQTANEEKVAVITGTSSGIGFETALAFAREGYYTYATMRDTSKGDRIKETSQKENLKIDVCTNHHIFIWSRFQIQPEFIIAKII